MESPWYIPLLIVGFTTVQGLLNFGGAYLNAWVGGKLTMGLKSRLYKKLVEIEPSFFDKTTSGEVLFRFNSDAELACSGLLGNLKSFLTRICSSIALIGVLFYNSWQLSILAIVILVVAVAPLTKVKKLLKSLVSRNNSCMFQLNTTYNETFSGNRTIAAYNLQERQKERFNGLLDDVFTLTVAMTRRTAWITPFMHFVISIGLGLAIALGSWLIVQGSISAGNFVSFITALLMLYTPLKNITNVAVSVQQSFLAIERVFSLLERPCVLLEKEHPDVVHLCLPHYLHVPVSEYFASHGVNVFCEKPVGLNTAQAKEFVEFEAAHPEVKIGICLQNRLNRTTVELKKIIDGGEYGKVIGCRGLERSVRAFCDMPICKTGRKG